MEKQAAENVTRNLKGHIHVEYPADHQHDYQ